jgi:Flp pilus assembly protein TadD
VRSRPRATAVEIETCGMCHGLRSQIHEPWRPGRQLLDTHLTSLLEPGLFEADGKMVGEVFNYQAFRQSRMFRAGVTCSDCHEPHALGLRAEGNGVCGQCHDAGTYDAAAHHHHPPGSAAARCVACHLPERTYMVVDKRHDHGFRVPRPDLTVRFGVTNACTDCHADRPPALAADAVERWHGQGRKGSQTWTEAFAAAWRGSPEAGRLLGAVAAAEDMPSIARATALAELGRHLTAARVPLFTKGLANPDPLVRFGALRGLAGIRAEALWPMVGPLLDDPVRGVRIEAASLLADMPQDRLPPADRARFERAAADYVAAQEFTADRPEGRVNLGTFLARRGRAADAEQALLGALAMAPDFVPAYVNLADLRAGAGREADAEKLLREALARAPADPALHHALGLSLARQERTEEATKALGRAAELDPGNARFAYVHAVALNSTGRTDEALRVLTATHGRHPADHDTLLALVTINRDRGDLAAASAWAEKLVAIDPEAGAFFQPPR